MVLWAYSSANGAKGREIESPWKQKKKLSTLWFIGWFLTGLCLYISQYSNLNTGHVDLFQESREVEVALPDAKLELSNILRTSEKKFSTNTQGNEQSPPLHYGHGRS